MNNFVFYALGVHCILPRLIGYRQVEFLRQATAKDLEQI